MLRKGVALAVRYVYAVLIGYARVPTDDQSPTPQLAALKPAMCKTIKQIRHDPIGNPAEIAIALLRYKCRPK